MNTPIARIEIYNGMPLAKPLQPWEVRNQQFVKLMPWLMFIGGPSILALFVFIVMH